MKFVVSDFVYRVGLNARLLEVNSSWSKHFTILT